MKKRRIKKHPPRVPQKISPRPPQPPPTRRQLGWLSLLQPKLLLIEIPSAIAVVIGFAVIWWQACPTVAAPSVAADAAPLAAPFVIKNEGSLLAFHDVMTTCTFDKMEWNGTGIGGTTLSQMSTDHPQPHGEVAPGRSVVVDCMVISAMRNWTKLHLTGDLLSMRAQIVVRYRTLMILRTFVSQHFCWTPTPPEGHQWELCDQL